MASGKQPARILVFRGGALGDLLLTLPTLDALRRRFLGAQIELVGYERSAVIALASGLVDRLRSLDSARMALYFQDREKLPPEEQEYIRSFDLVISFMHDPGNVLLKNLEQAGAPEVVAVSPLVSGGHAADHFLGAIAPVIGRGIEEPKTSIKTISHFIKCDYERLVRRNQYLLKRTCALKEKACMRMFADKHARKTVSGKVSYLIKCDCEPKGKYDLFRLAWPDKLKAKARRRMEKFLSGKKMIVIHPGSGSPVKNWPAEKFIELAKKINSGAKYKAVIMGGEADEKAIAPMRELMPGEKFIINAPLANAASVIASAAGYVGNDSGITHMAALLGVPSVALFGPTDPAVWAPRGVNVAVISGKGGRLDAIGVEEVYARIIALMEKIKQ
ncbi:MAG: glycosyltransferase family 9 protein [Kiritimatiellia bacterium]